MATVKIDISKIGMLGQPLKHTVIEVTRTTELDAIAEAIAMVFVASKPDAEELVAEVRKLVAAGVLPLSESTLTSPPESVAMQGDASK